MCPICVHAALRGQKKVSDPLKMELQRVVSLRRCRIANWVLRQNSKCLSQLSSLQQAFSETGCDQTTPVLESRPLACLPSWPP